MDTLNLDDLRSQIHQIAQHVTTLKQQISESPTLQQAADTRQQLEIMATAFQELNTALDALQVTKDITERKQAEEAQRSSLNAAARSAKLLQMVVTNAPIVLYALDSEGVFTLSEGKGLEALGIKPGEYVGHSVFESYRNYPNIVDNIRRVLNGTEATWQAQVGNVVYENRATPVRDETGQVVGLIGVATDVTDRNRAEDALSRLNEQLENRVRERIAELERLNQQLLVEISDRILIEASLHRREQEFRALVENAPDIIERFDRNLRHIYVNPTVEKVSSRLASEYVGKTLRELGVSEATTSLWEEVLSRIFTTGQEEQIEFSSLTPQGLKYYQTRFVPEFGQDGSIESVLGISRDITDHKLALEALQESEQRFRQLAENINAVFWMISIEPLQIIYVSPAYEAIWGRTCESLYSNRVSWLEAIHPDDRDRILVATDKRIEGIYDEEYRIVRPDGSTRWIRDRGFPIHDAQGKVYRLAGIAEDITTRKLAELETYKMLQREQELGELKSRFVTMTSHEFRTPLSTIQSSTELLERYRHKFSLEKQQTHFFRIQTAVNRMTQMLNDILLIGEAEGGKLEFKPTPVDLLQFCRNLITDLQVADKNQHVIAFIHQDLRERNRSEPFSPSSVQLTGQVAPTADLLPLLDEKLLRHILGNLLSNAIKYSPINSTVDFKLTYLGDQVIFQIQDQGIGIPPEDQSLLFDSFHRATNVGTIQGTGLGLAIVKQCIDLHKGKISVNSEVGKGTTFTVTLPFSNKIPRSTTHY